MMCFEDTVTIAAPIQSIAAWLRHLPEHYKEWHPKDHLEIHVPTGERELHQGSIVHVVERLGNYTLSLKFIITYVNDEHEVRWEALFPHNWYYVHGSFAFAEKEGRTKVTSVSCWGWRIPILGRVVDWIVDRFVLPKADVIKHMREEGEYMKAAIERDLLLKDGAPNV